MKKTRKILSLILAVVMMCSVFAGVLTASAATSGPYSYELINNGKEVKITAYNENKAIVSIPSRIAGKPVTVIGAYAFSGIGRLQNVYLPLSVKTIEDHAFYQCNRITGLTIPANVDVIGDYTFAGCNRLEWVTIMNGTERIGDHAFAECDRLQKIRIPGSVRQIGSYAFYGCGRLETVSMKKGVQEIGDYAFAACNRIEKVHFPKTVTRIGDRAFWGDVRLMKVYFDGNAPELGDSVFLMIENNAKLYHKKGNNTFQGGQWERFQQKTFLICPF
ncbi:MAG: leucine-rich repeat domain-containing protein [Candidatus Fimivicinus sp.]|nr:leucine-rich repeat domain-containing protein [Oscillospiraceae bacterium]MDY5591731.1 leucine-rich repeat domain-containing protein [Candidatus Fimivicinus sp.]